MNNRQDKNAGRTSVRVVIYARFSTDGQNPRSIDDQVAKCQAFVAGLELGHVEEIVCSDAATSGELGNRPGIDRVRQLVESRDCDVIVAEDASRIFRHTTFAMSFFEAAKDAGIRVLTVNDRIDTNDEQWRMNAHFASIRGELYNADTAARIRRAHEGLWRNGFAVTKCNAGYRRVPSHPATEREPARGPYRDEKDERWTPVIRRAFEMIADGESASCVAHYLNECGLPKPVNHGIKEWTDHNVINLIHNPIYAGTERFRQTQCKKRFSTGKTAQVETPAAEVLYREMPHLAHVSLSLRQRANDALTKRRTCAKLPKGDAHPNKGVPRDRWGPLSKIFVCGVCDSPMYRDGACYRCADCKPRPTRRRRSAGPCWNRCSPQTHVVHNKIGSAIADALVKSAGSFETILDEVARLIRNGDGTVRRQIERFMAEEAELKRQSERLRSAIEIGGELEVLVAQLQERERQRSDIRTEISRLSRCGSPKAPVPNADDVRRLVDEAKGLFLNEMGRDAAPLLRRLCSPIRAVPYRHFKENRIVLRAHFTLNLVGLLPDDWRDLTIDSGESCMPPALATVAQIPMVVDLYDEPQLVRFGPPCAQLQAQGLSRRQIAQRLRIPEWLVKGALRFARDMAEQNLVDAFIRLESRPTKLPGKWRQLGPHQREAKNERQD